jgi:hypothetical protein
MELLNWSKTELEFYRDIRFIRSYNFEIDRVAEHELGTVDIGEEFVNELLVDQLIRGACEKFDLVLPRDYQLATWAEGLKGKKRFDERFAEMEEADNLDAHNGTPCSKCALSKGYEEFRGGQNPCSLLCGGERSFEPDCYEVMAGRYSLVRIHDLIRRKSGQTAVNEFEKYRTGLISAWYQKNRPGEAVPQSA